MAAALKLFDDIYYLPCAGHKLNSTVNDLFKVRSIKEKEVNYKTLYKVKDFENGQLKSKEISSQEYQNISLINRSKEYIALQFIFRMSTFSWLISA